MIITIVLLAILAAVTGLLFCEGLWRSLLMFFNVLVAATIATAWFAPLANLLEGPLPSYTYLLDFLSVWLLFCGVLSLARAATDWLSPEKIVFPQRVDQLGAACLGFLTAWVMVAFTAATLHLAPVPRDLVQPTPEARMCFGLAPDRKWLSWVRGSSRSGSFSLPDQAFDKDADLILRYADRRLKLEAAPGLRVSAQ